MHSLKNKVGDEGTARRPHTLEEGKALVESMNKVRHSQILIKPHTVDNIANNNFYYHFTTSVCLTVMCNSGITCTSDLGDLTYVNGEMGPSIFTKCVMMVRTWCRCT